MELVVAGDVDGGVAELEEAYVILPHPNVLYNIGRAYAEAGRYDEARDYFERYLDSDPPDREEVRAVVAAIDQRLAARSAQAAATQPETTSPEVIVESTPAASVEQLAILDASIAQVQGLCDATGSTNFCERAHALRALRDELASTGRPVAATPPPCTDDCPEPPTEAPSGGIEVRASSSEDAAYVETVDAAARQRSSSLDAPASTTIITRQDIRLSGITQIGELLRRAPGVSVMNPTPGDANVGIRGFNRLLSPRVLMLVNGRTTYVDPLGTPFWDTQPIQVEDIERIEVIRGPASVLYGANGFSGIVNIVLRAPGDSPGTEMTVGLGNDSQVRAHFSTSGRVGDLAYRFNAGYRQFDRYSLPFDPARADVSVSRRDLALAQQMSMVGGQLRYRASRNVTLLAEGGVLYAHQYNFYVTGAFLDFNVNGPNSYVSLAMQTPYGRIRTFYNRFSTQNDVVDGSIRAGTFANNTFDVEAELTRSFHLVVDHDVHLGLNYRLKNVDWTFLQVPYTEHHVGVFFEDTMQVGSKLRLVGAVRMDRHPLLPRPVFSPRGAVIVRPTEGQSIRLTAGTAFRTPAMQDTYINFAIPSPVSAVGVNATGTDVARRLFGSRAVRPEHVTSFELGYQNQSSDYFAFDVSGYFNLVRDLIGLANTTSPLTIADYAGTGPDAAIAGFDPVRNQFTFGTTNFENEPDRYKVVGAEAAVRVFPIDGLDVYANYALNQTFVTHDPLGRTRDNRTSSHMVNAGIQYRTSFGLDLSADVHYSSATVWPETVSSASGIERQLLANPAYYLLNARVGMRLLGDRLELSVAGYNVTNAQRRQHPYGQPVDARVLAQLAARF